MEDKDLIDGMVAQMLDLTEDDRKRVFAQLKVCSAREKAARCKRSRLRSTEEWSKAHLLRTIPNGCGPQEQKFVVEELTFEGVANQPDFGRAMVTLYPKDSLIELKSLKIWKDAFRSELISWERFADVMYHDLMKVYQPVRLRLVVMYNRRGGIPGAVTIDSDWRVRGGKEQFTDWKNQVDGFGFAHE